MRYLDIRRNLVVPNVSWGIKTERQPRLHECDILSLTKSGYATEVEIKVSRSDLLKDCDKSHNHEHEYIKYLYFAVTKSLESVALDCIPARAGLYVVEKKRTETVFDKVYEYYYVVNMVRGARERKGAHKWTKDERYDLARLGALRILGLKTKLIKK